MASDGKKFKEAYEIKKKEMEDEPEVQENENKVEK